MKILLLTAIVAGCVHGATGYAGSEACKTCHADVWSTFYRNPHFRSGPKEACEGCHGPGQLPDVI